MTGGAWRWDGEKKTKWYEGEVGVYFLDTQHPVVKGFSNFDWKDEIYYDMDLREDIHALATAHVGKTVVVACHGGVIDVAFRSFLRAPLAGSFELFTINPAITSFERVGPVRWKLERYNDAAHLDGLE